MQLRIIETRGKPSRKLLRLAAMLGVGVRQRRMTVEAASAAGAERIVRDVPPGSVVLLTGPSGSGKSVLLRTIERMLRTQGQRVVSVRSLRAQPKRFMLDALGVGALRAAETLASAGLADAMLLGRRICELSDGERARFSIALAMVRAGRGDWISVDELASVLDRHAARGLCMLLARWAQRSGVRIICATAHEDVVAWLTAACSTAASGTTASPTTGAVRIVRLPGAPELTAGDAA